MAALQFFLTLLSVCTHAAVAGHSHASPAQVQAVVLDDMCGDGKGGSCSVSALQLHSEFRSSLPTKGLEIKYTDAMSDLSTKLETDEAERDAVQQELTDVLTKTVKPLREKLEASSNRATARKTALFKLWTEQWTDIIKTRSRRPIKDDNTGKYLMMVGQYDSATTSVTCLNRQFMANGGADITDANLCREVAQRVLGDVVNFAGSKGWTQKSEDGRFAFCQLIIKNGEAILGGLLGAFPMLPEYPPAVVGARFCVLDNADGLAT